MEMKLCVLVLIFSCLLVLVNGHGRLLEPPSRSSMFRYKNTDPMLVPYKDIIKSNYNDNQLFCGGKQVQKKNGGKCGVCGDAYNAAQKDNEAGGKYALGIITRQYTQGSFIDVKVQITAAHKGYFEFRLCPWNKPDTPVTHECLNRHLLMFENGETKYYLPKNTNEATKTHDLRLKLPDEVLCDQCVLQWRYRTGNTWYRDGLGQQEEFYGCADVAIVASEGGQSTSSKVPATSERVSPSTTSTAASTTVTTPPATSTTTNIGERPSNGNVPSSTTTRKTKNPIQSANVDCNGVPPGKHVCIDCYSFFKCILGRYFEFQCSSGTRCNRRNGRCDYPYRVGSPCNN